MAVHCSPWARPGRFSSAQALRSLELLLIDCGTRDEFALQHGARILAERLRAQEIPHVHEEFDDGHFNIPYRYDWSIPCFAAADSFKAAAFVARRSRISPGCARTDKR